MPTAAPDPTLFPAGAGPLPVIPGVAVEHEFHELPGGRFHVARIGDRSLPAIMLVHGYPQHWWGWRGVIEALHGEAHLIVPDLRGHGWSTVPDTIAAYRKREFSEDLLHLLDALEIPQIAVVGHDWGAFSSQLLALDHPERVSRLLAFSISPVVLGPRPPIRSALRMYYQLAFSAPFSDLVVRRGTRQFARAMRKDVQRPEGFTHADAMAFAALYRDPARAKASQRIYRSFVFGDAARTFASVKGARFAMPVRFILSQHDGYIPPQLIRGIERLGEHVDGWVQDRTGHFVMDEDPTYVADQIREWVLPHAAPLPNA